MPFDTSHQEVLCSGGYSPIGDRALGENLGSVCRQDSQTLSLEYTFVAKNIHLNIQILSKITRPFLKRHNARDSLKVLAKNLSLSKNMKTLLLHITLI